MILEKNDRLVESSGLLREAAFTINQNDLSHIFSILRNQMYSNKPLAVIREYSTNAYDAHIDNGCEMRPIEVTLPNSLAAEFKVRDYGKGLTDNEIEEVYVCYGTSTKRNSNAQVGQLGLGSKSAFCYSLSFTITSFKDGTKSVYSAFIDETEIGKVVKLLDEPTTEENGIEITVPINYGDINLWNDTASKFYQYFTPRPIFKGNVRIKDTLDQYDAILPYAEGKNWKLYKSGSSRLVMGNVAYPLSTQAFMNDPALQNVYTLLNQGSVVIYANIGDVAIVSSREALDYNPTTIKYVKECALQIVEELNAATLKEVDSAPDIWTARILVNSLHNNNDWLKRLLPKTFTWKGQPFTGGVIEKTTIDDWKTNAAIDIKTYDGLDSRKLSSYIPSSIRPGKNVGFVLNKGDFNQNHLSSRIRGAGQEFNLNVINLITVTDIAKLNVFLKHEEIQGAQIIDLATVKGVPYANTTHTPNTKRKSKVFTYNKKTYNTHNSDAWDEIDVDLENDSGVYINIFAYRPADSEQKWLRHFTRLDDFARTLTLVEQAGITMPTVIYGIREGQVVGAKWEKLEDYLAKAIAKYIDDNKLNTILYYSDQLKNVNHFYNGLVARPDFIKRLPAGCKLLSYIEEIQYASANADKTKLAKLTDIQNRIDVGVDCKPNANKLIDLKAMQADVESSYPMLSIIQDYVGWRLFGSEGVVDQFIEYINRLS